jgi:NADH-quinone oxidoreductase subunit C
MADMTEALKDLAAYVAEKMDGRVQDSFIEFGELTLLVEGGDILDVLTFLRDDVQCQFISIIDICGADYPERERRF